MSELNKFEQNVAKALKKDPEFEKQVYQVVHEKHRWRWRALAVWIVAFSIVVGFGVRSNRQRANDIQKARLESCERSKNDFEIIVRKIIPATNSRQSIEFFKILHKTVQDLKKKCPQQTGVKVETR